MVRRVFGRNEAGASAVEFALIAPIFVFILMAVLMFGLFFTVSHGVQQIAADAARAAVGGLDDAERTSLAQTRASSEVGGYPLLLADRMEVEAGPVPGEPDLFRVTVRYDASHLGLTVFAGLLPSPPDHIERASIIRRGGW